MAAILEFDERLGPAANAQRVLPELAAAYFARVRGTLEKRADLPRFHRLRLATKKLRYTLELFRSCYGPGLETRLEALQHLQQLLGDVSDSIAAARVVAGSLARSPRRAQLKRLLDERAEAAARRFRAHWKRAFDAPGEEGRWTRYLAHPVGAPRRRT